MTLAIEYACPKCGAKPNSHQGAIRTLVKIDRCTPSSCLGFICECDSKESYDNPEHGTSYAHVCEFATCYHCGWSGIFPAPKKTWPKWTKEALKAGWTPPEGWAP